MPPDAGIRAAWKARRPSAAAVLIAGALLPGLPLSAQAPGVESAIDGVFADFDHWDVPGAAVAVIRHGEVLYRRGYGSAQLEYGIPITPSTPFHVASVSKEFTCMAIILLAQEGKLSLDDDIRRWIPEVHDYGTTITLRHLAHHTSGLRDQWELLAMSGFRLDDVITRDHILKIVARQRELNFPVGAEYLYSNTGYTLLAEVVARASGMSFPEFTERRIFKPLGMSHTHFHDDHEMMVPGRAYSYAPRDGGFRKAVLSFANAGATSLFTTAEDLVRWLDNFRTGRVGGTAGLEQMRQKGVLASGEEIDYAWGISHGNYRGTPVLSHGGADAGFRSFVLWAPEHEVGVAVVSNFASFDTGGSAQRVLDAVVGDVLEPLPEAPPAAPSARTAVEVDADTLSEYLGTYRLVELQALTTVERRGRSLYAKLPDGSDSILVAQSETEFLVPANGVRIVFDRTAGRPSPGFLATLGDQRFHGERIRSLEGDALAAIAGTYHSEELGTQYEIIVSDGLVVARHARHPDIDLVAASEDELLGSQWFFARLLLERDAAGDVTGFRLSGGRVRNVLFERL